MWRTIKVCVDKNVKEAAEALKWDFNKTGIQVRWKPHQSADSGTQVQIVCCPDLFDKEGITKELLFHMKEVEKKMITKGQLPSTLIDDFLPLISISRQQRTQGKGQNKGEKLLLLNNLPSFSQNGCMVLTIKTEEGTWVCFGPIWRMLNRMGLVRRIFERKAVLIVLYGGKPTELDRNTLQHLS